MNTLFECTFCQKLTRPCEDDVQINYVVHRCDYHRYVVKYYFLYDRQIAGKTSHVETTIFYHDYRLNFHMKEACFEEEFNIQHKGANKFKTILTLPFHPNITPENVKEKLPLYLTFL
jgi:hypothetical protein